MPPNSAPIIAGNISKYPWPASPPIPVTPMSPRPYADVTRALKCLGTTSANQAQQAGVEKEPMNVSVTSTISVSVNDLQ